MRGLIESTADGQTHYGLYLLSGDAHAHRPLHKMDGVFFFFRFVGQLLEHPVWRHLPLPAHYFFKFYGKFENRVHLFRQI